jgi:hypothetical protein
LQFLQEVLRSEPDGDFKISRGFIGDADLWPPSLGDGAHDALVHASRRAASYLSGVFDVHLG